ncbi:MAG TPA: nitroreductase [Streptosporangiaceae bacterium]|nr:nitroreductase [Streptosporangiaceae bacterium]
MELADAVRGRRSATRLSDPGPSDEEVYELVTDAATGPDHGLLRPWRLVLVRGEARQTLGDAFAADLPDDDEAGRARAAAKPLRAPLLVSIICAPRDVPKVPPWEQLASAVAMAHNLALLLHDRGWGAMWRTGEPSRSAAVRDLLGVGPDEQLLGWLYVGTPAAVPAAERPALDIAEKVSVLGPDGVLSPLAGSLTAR